MTKSRVRLGEKESVYFTAEKENIRFISTGCAVLDCVLGGGPALGRMLNIVGDKSTAKTGLAGEIMANFIRRYPAGKAAYRETEGAYDVAYAEAMSIPVEDIDYGDEAVPIETVEAFASDLKAFTAKRKEEKEPGCYILDSLDALSSESEMAKDLKEGSYDMDKQKKMGKMFRQLVRQIEDSETALIIVSQIRENIGVSFGEKYRRSGGKAMDFYASQALWLAHLGQIKKTIKKVQRVVGIKVKAKCKKNKIGMPFRECDFDFIFGFGIDDVGANLEWLKSVRRNSEVGISDKDVSGFSEDLRSESREEYNRERKRIAKVTKRVWAEIENTFLPTMRKYE